MGISYHIDYNFSFVLSSSMQLKLHALTKRQFALVYLAFFFGFIILILVGVTGPPVLTPIAANYSNSVTKPTHSSLNSGPFTVNTGEHALNLFNQQLWLFCRLKINEQSSVRILGIVFQVKATVKGRNKDGHYVILSDFNRTRKLECKGSKCEEFMVFHVGFLNFEKYEVIVRFHGLDAINVTNVRFEFQHYNVAYSRIELWLRFIFAVCSFVIGCVFIYILRTFGIHQWTVEQKWLSFLLPLLLLFNNPLYPLKFLVTNASAYVIDAIFESSFIAALLLFWLCISHSMREHYSKKFFTFYAPKILLVGLLWIAAFTLSVWQETIELNAPIEQYAQYAAKFEGLKVFLYILIGLYVLYLLYLLVRAYGELRNLAFHEFVILFGVLNFYIYMMAFIYSPAKFAIEEAMNKRNAVFSALNGEERVIYGRKRSKNQRLPLESDEDEELSS
ncbi:Transmembrane protein 181 [Trichoplax sp. H2]|nr:Transmembrane protein 181 [Trichoplax sp. H2]|eukprot:RDD37797.1 Transmembrane protein 181 [Trichoplax sp. H2]